MSKKVINEAAALLGRELAPYGYRKRKEAILTRELNEESLGFVGLSYSDGHGKLSLTMVGPIIGVRNHAIQEIWYEILQKQPGPYKVKRDGYLPTVSTPLGSLMPGQRNLTWDFDEGADNEAVAHHLAHAIETYGHPFMEAHASLPAVAAVLLDRRSSYRPIQQADTRALIALFLLGDFDRLRAGLKDIDDEIAKTELTQRMEQAIGAQRTEFPPEGARST